MDVTLAIADSIAPTLAQAASPSTVPAKRAKPVTGPLDGKPVVLPQVPKKDGSNAPGSEKPKGPLVRADALQSASSPWDDTQAAIADVKRLAKLQGKSPEFEGACEHLLRAVSDEITAMVGPKPGVDALDRASDALVRRAGLPDKSIIAAAVEVVFERLVWGTHVAMGAQLPPVEHIWRSVMGVATGVDSRVARHFPNLLTLENDFLQASHQFDVVNTDNNLGKPVLKQSIDKLQDAAKSRRDAWQDAVAKSYNPGLEDACQRGLSAANEDVKRVNDPSFVESHADPAAFRRREDEHMMPRYDIPPPP
jgi:hypothetical protein